MNNKTPIAVFFLSFIVCICSFANNSFAQKSYKEVIIPTIIPAFGDRINPYQISSSLQTILTEKGISSTFTKDANDDSYCDALQADIAKENSFLRCKLSITLQDCMGREIWKGEGEGNSKDYMVGYKEALADALKDFDELPQNLHETDVKETAVVAEVEVAPVLAKVYYNEKYILDLSDADNGNKVMKVVNGEKLGYDKLQTIAELEPTDVPNMFSASFTDTDGQVWNGIAVFKNDELSLKLADGEEKMTISLFEQ